MSHKVSVVIPSHNSERFLAHAVNSVTSQTYEDWQLVVVDDGSTDSSHQLAYELLKDIPGSKVLSTNRQLGAAAARNLGILDSQGE